MHYTKYLLLFLLLIYVTKSAINNTRALDPNNNANVITQLVDGFDAPDNESDDNYEPLSDSVCLILLVLYYSYILIE
jgi:hypothetical protein